MPIYRLENRYLFIVFVILYFESPHASSKRYGRWSLYACGLTDAGWMELKWIIKVLPALGTVRDAARLLAHRVTRFTPPRRLHNRRTWSDTVSSPGLSRANYLKVMRTRLWLLIAIRDQFSQMMRVTLRILLDSSYRDTVVFRYEIIPKVNNGNFVPYY